MVAGGNISKNQPQSSSINYHSKDISELFPTVPISSYFILIEGAPGIGKTVLSKEIACQWAENKLLKFKNLLFLLYLRDPALKNMKMLEQLTQYVLNNNKKGTELSDHLFETKGKDLTIIFDGYDEMSEEDRIDSLVAKIISRKVLPECVLVITSRPTASLHLRGIADCRVEVLGFTEEDRLDYIKHALEGSLEKIEVLQSYLRSNTTINALCYIPLNMTILLCLYEDIVSSQISALNIDNIKKIGLPTTQTEMYKNFILMAITRCVNKNTNTFSGKYLEITELPEPYNEVFNELLHLAYHALTKDKIVFNSDEEFIQKFCKNLKSGSCEGLGLLKVTKHVKTVSCHFLHFSIQEYLAAYYIASQSDKFQVQLLKNTFWDIHYFNTWIMYVGMTGGKKIAWKHFVSGNWFMLSTKIFKSSKISKKYLNDKIKSLHLFQCYAEIGNKEFVRKVFEDKIIDLSNQTLLPKDINTICFFLLRSANKHWIKLDLSNCNIGITGSDILCKTFLDKSRDVMSIDKVYLSHNQLQSQSILELLDVLKIWHASEAEIYDTYDYSSDLFESCLNKFPLYDDNFSHAVLIGPYIFAHNVHIHNLLINSANVIIGLYLNHCNYPPSNIKYGELSNKLNLSKLHIIGENIPCYYIVTLIQTIKEVDSMYIYDHTLSDEDVQYISLMICKMNLRNLGVWIVIGSTKILGNIPDISTLINKLSCIEALNLTENIKILCSNTGMCTDKFNERLHTECKSVFENFFYLFNENISKCEITFCLLENNILIASGVEYSKIKEILFSYNHLVSIRIANCKYKLIATELLTVAELTSLLSKQESLEKFYLSDSSLDIHNLMYENLLNQTLKLKELFIHTTNSSCVFNFNLLKAKECYPNIAVLLLTNNTLIGHNPTCKQILLSLKLEPNLTTWRINHFPISTELLQKISNSLSTVMELDIVDFIHEEHVLQQDNNRSNNVEHNLEKNDKLAISKFLSYFPKLETFNFSHNDLQEVDTGKIFKYLNIYNLSNLNISHNEINKQVVDDIAQLLSQISMLTELDLSCNNLQATEAVKLLSEVKNISSCTKLNFNNSDINGKAARYIATFFCNNTLLKELNLSHSNLQTEDAIIICNAMSNLRCLTKLNISNNGIDGKAADDIAVFLSQNILLEELDICYNNLGAISSLHIFHAMKRLSSLIKLNLCSIGLTDNAANDIVTVLNNNIELQDLDLSHNNLQAIGATTIFKMASNKNLHKFNISHNNINDDVKFLELFLSGNTNLKEIDFSHNNLQATGIKKVCKTNLTTFEKFDISHNSITIDAADDLGAFLACNYGLQQIDLSGNKLEKSGYESIFKHLQLINLISLKISYSSHMNEAVYQLADFLLQKENLQEIDLSHNSFSVSHTIVIFSGMTNISNLVTIDVSHNMINYEGGYELAAVLSHNTRLKDINLSYTNLLTVTAINIFKGMKNISHLIAINISHNMITDEAAEDIAFVLTRNKKLQSLDLSYNWLTSKGFVSIFDCLKIAIDLRKLSASANEFNIKAAHSIGIVLSHNSKLEELDFGNTCMNTPTAAIIFKSLRHSSNLKKLYINGNMITDEAAVDIAVVLSQNNKLEELDVSYNHLQTAGILKIFEGINHTLSLSKLNIAHNMVTNVLGECIVDSLSSKIRFKELNMSHTNLSNAIKFEDSKHSSLNILNSNSNKQTTNEAIHFLSQYPDLQVLNLSYTNLQETDYTEMLNEIDIFNLTTFNISGNSITADSADNIAVLLSKNDELEDLDLSCNNLQELGIRNILDSISITNLRSLNISDNHITGLKYIAGILNHATKLVKLDVSYNNLSAESMMYFLHEMAGIFVNLVKLNLSGNIFSHKVAKSLANALLKNTILIELSLSDNNLHNKEICKIFNELKISTLIRFSINHNNITDEAADCIATFLSRNPKLEELDLSHNDLLSAGAMKICWTKLSKLTSFNISHNGIKANAAEDIATFLSRNTELQQLDLSHNSLLSRGIMIICKINLSKLTSINIGHNNITVEATDDIADFLNHNAKLQFLDLSCSDLQETGCRNIFKVLQNVSTLASLEVSNCNIDAVDELSKVLHNNMFLQKLDLSYNNLSKSDFSIILKKMNNISNLTTLNVSHNMITDEVSGELETVLLRYSSLQQLDLGHNNFSSSSVMNMLKNVSNLVRINISHTRINNTTVNSLVHFLICNPSLKEINLSSNHISASNAVKIFNGMENTSNLETINVSNNMITDEAAESISTVLSHNSKLKSLNLSFNYFRSEGFVKIFNGMRNIVYLKELVISSNEITALNAIDCIANFLFHNLELETLDLSNSFIQKAGIIKIFNGMKKISNLRKINIHGNVITKEAADAIASVLSQNTKLEEINIGYTNLQTESAGIIFQSIMHISSLIRFNFAHSTVTNEAVAYILSNNKKLRELNLSHSEIILSDLSKCDFTNLQELNVSYTNLQTVLSIGNLDVVTLKKCNISANHIPANKINSISSFLFENNELQELDLSFNNLQDISTKSIFDFDYFVDVLINATKLVELDLSYNKFSSFETDYIFCKAKSILGNIIKLNLSGNEICNGAANALANALVENSKLKELSLCDVDMQSEEVSKIFGKIRFPHLTKLSISHNNITDEAADVLADFLSKSNGLEELDVSHNNLKSAGIIRICRTNLTKLTRFNVRHNSITSEAAAYVASFLSHNSKLQMLDISCNDLLKTSSNTIFTALKSMIILSVLKLTNCHLTNGAADELANVLLHSNLLQEFDLSYNSLSTSAAINIFKGMRNITHLIVINISHNMITDEAAEDIATVLSCNNKIQSLDLSCNYFTSKGFIKIFKFECLKNIIYLKKLSISSNKINVNAAHSIGTVLSLNSTLEEVDISSNLMQAPGSNLMQAPGSNLMQAPAATIIFKSLRHSKSLKKVYINNNLINDKAADELAIVLFHNTSLQKIDLSNNNLSSSDAIKIFEGMRNITNLEAIDISYNMIRCEATMELATVLSHNNNLQSLDISHNNLNSDGCKKVMDEMNNKLHLKKIDISYNQVTSAATDSIAAFLSHNSKLEELILSGNDFYQSYLLDKIKTIKLTKLCISFTLLEVDDIATALMHNTKLEDIYLSNNKLLSSDIIKICQSMKNILNLKRIDISHNCVDYEAADDIANVLSHNINLLELYLNNNYLQSQGITSLFSEMSNVVKLTHLDISSNKITDKASDDIATFLLRSNNLEVLDLSNNLIKSRGARKIFEKANTSLKVLNLSGNALDDEAADTMAIFVSQNPLLEEFDISVNCLQAVGAVKIFKAIQNCPSLLKVNMSNNGITDEAGDEIATVLSTVTKLQKVNLTYNMLSAKMSENIKRAFVNLLI